MPSTRVAARGGMISTAEAFMPAPVVKSTTLGAAMCDESLIQSCTGQISPVNVDMVLLWPSC